MQNSDPNSQFVTSSGNVFADLGLPNADERLAKAKLIHAISELIRQRGLSQSEAAELLGINQPKISDLMRGKAFGYSIERLFRFLNALSIDIEIKMVDRNSHESTGSIMLTGQC
ncbi:MAG: helix-turn-helix transcriptional regulator [Candidatus Caenarcaniphilales bacterium]|nr:helix-turn-helix transcriptional regulator [Candidatus Caenarcaniphilales bacterium]